VIEAPNHLMNLAKTIEKFWLLRDDLEERLTLKAGNSCLSTSRESPILKKEEAVELTESENPHLVWLIKRIL